MYQRIPHRCHSFPSCIAAYQSVLLIFLHLQPNEAEACNKRQSKLVFPERNTNCTVGKRRPSHSSGSAEAHAGVQFGHFHTRVVSDPAIKKQLSRLLNQNDKVESGQECIC